MSSPVHDIATSKTAAAAAITGTVLGFTLSEWAALVTIVFVLMQIVVLMPKFVKQCREYWRKFSAWRSKRG